MHDPDALAVELPARVRDRPPVGAPTGELILRVRPGGQRTGVAAVGVHDPDLLVRPEAALRVAVVLMGVDDLLAIGRPGRVDVGAARLAARTAREGFEAGATPGI